MFYDLFPNVIWNIATEHKTACYEYYSYVYDRGISLQSKREAEEGYIPTVL